MALLTRARAGLRSNAAIYLLGTIVSRIGSIVLIPLYTRKLSPDEYGEYSLAVSGLSLLPMCASLGLTAGISRVYFALEDREAATRAMGAVSRGLLAIVALVLGVVALALWLFAPDVLFGVHRRFWLLVVLAAGGTAAYSVPELFFRATQAPKRVVTLQLSAFFLNAGLGLLLVLVLGRGLSGALEATTLAWLAVGAFGVVFILRLPSANVTSETRSALGVSVALVPHFIGSWLQMTADRWVLSAFGASASLGAYYLAVQLLSPLPMVSAAFNDAEAPRYGEIYRAGGAEAAYAKLKSLYPRYLVVVLVPAALILLGSPLLPLLIGPRFLGVLGVLPLLGLAYVVDAFYYPATNFLFFVGRTSLLPVVTVTAGVIAIGLSILLLPRFGLTGLLVSRIVASVVRSGGIGLAAHLARPASRA